ncbi:hypothetical protein BGZ65_011561 [Modicella reniformis]|uniref:Uncharacterized protein n=1 Tax=Modicella reniformis TaxID=1440133 RepID=A0A9P6SNQ1_9FUNG|nr:hypothetical protein BGZ65_011561 [Modicella reniformis]
MSATDDDRKQRFRFHKEDEILLLQIVLSAKPCPYNISSRDGAIMVAWNSIAEEFKARCVPRSDGKLPLPRTCRTRCDKMITDYLASHASPNLKKQKQESREDKIKNELLKDLAHLQGRFIGREAGNSDNGDADAISVGSGAAGSNAVSVTQLLAQSAPSSSFPSSSVALNVGDSQGHGSVPGHTHQTHRNSTSATSSSIMPQSAISLGGSGHRTNHAQVTTELLASGILIPGATVASSSSSPSAPSAIPDKTSKQAGVSMAARKRRGNNSTETTATTSLNYLQQRSASSSSTSVQIQHNNPRRFKPIAMKPSQISSSANTHGQQTNNHHSSALRSTVGSIISGLGSSLAGQDLTGLSSVGVTVEGDSDDNEEDDDEDEDDDDNEQGFQDAQEDLGNNYEDDDDGDHDSEEYPESASLLSHQNGSTSTSRGDIRRGTKRAATSASATAAAAAAAAVAVAATSSMLLPGSSSPYGRSSSSHSLQRHTSNNNLNKSPLSPLFSGGPSGNMGYVSLSQMTPEDRSYQMQRVTLEEQWLKVEMDKIALEREKLAFERMRLQLEMRPKKPRRS